MKTKTKAADRHKVAMGIFRALGKVTADHKAGRPHLERVCVQKGEAEGIVRLEATDGTRAVRLDVREDMLPDGLALGRYDLKRAAAMLALGQAPSPECADYDKWNWPDFSQCIPQRTDEGEGVHHYDPALLGAALATVAALTYALQGHKKPRPTRMQLGMEKAPCRIDVSGDGWSLVAVVMPMRE